MLAVVQKTSFTAGLLTFLEQFETGKLPAMITRAGYPGIAADLDLGKIASVLPAMNK